MAKRSRMGEAFATDLPLYARIVDRWAKPMLVNNDGAMTEDPSAPAHPEPISINDIAWECGISQGKAAITMKYAVEQGFFRRVSPRTDQATFEPTEKGLRELGDGGIFPAYPAGIQLESGAVITPAGGDEARSWSSDPEYVEITDPEVQRKLRQRLGGNHRPELPK